MFYSCKYKKAKESKYSDFSTNPSLNFKFFCHSNVYLTMQGLDTVESLSVKVKGPKVANFTVLVTLLPTFVISSSVGGTKSKAFAAKSW